MKKLLLFIVGCLFSIVAHSQNFFETIIQSDDGVRRGAHFVVETNNHSFIISCSAQFVFQNDMLVLLSPNGEVVNERIFQIEDKNLKYCGLFKHPQYSSDYLAIAVLSYGNTNDDCVQREIAFIRLDAELSVVEYSIWNLGDSFTMLATTHNDFPKFLIDDDGTIVMAAHCLKKDSYCYLFARITSQGEIVSMREDVSMNEKFDFLYSLFVRKRECKSYGMIKFYNHDSGGDFYYLIDSAFNCERVKRLSTMEIRVVQEDPNQTYPDTTFYYQFYQGSGEYYNDTSFLVTCTTQYLKTSKYQFGYGHFISQLNDSANVLNTKVWDCHKLQTDHSTTTLSAMTQPLSVTDRFIYHCGITGVKQHGYYITSSTKTRIVVGKFDRDLNQIWRRYYGLDDCYYDINTVEATEDGGCIMTGIYANNPGSFYSYILKVDENGYDALGENTESKIKPYCCYPNPTSDVIYIDLSPDVTCQYVELYNIDGRLVETFQETSLQTTIDISGLNAGMYIIKIRMAEGKEYTEHIVKE